MKVELSSPVEYDEVDTAFQMKLPALFQRLQRGALHHSESVGLGAQAMVRAGAVWVLSRMRVHIRRLPAYGETVVLKTWHKGSAGFRAGRDFVVSCGDEIVAAATSQWLYYDFKRKRIAKIPMTLSGPYTDEPEDALAPGAIDFTVDRTFDPDQTLTLTTRRSDHDPNGHVNNTVYLDYLDTLLQRAAVTGEQVRQVGIQYIKEIDREVRSIQGGLATAEDRCRFRFYDPSAVYAAGFVTVSCTGRKPWKPIGSSTRRPVQR
jgi:acyl-ACP thioesterase